MYTCCPSWTLLPPPFPYPPSGSSQCTSPKHPVSCIEPGLATRFIYDIIHVSMPFSQIIPPSPSPTESKRLFYTLVSLLLSRIQGYCYHLSKFHIYVLVYYIGVFLSGLLHSVCILNTHLFILKITNHFNWFSFISVLQNFFHLFSPHLSFFYPTNKYQIPLSTVYLFICSVLEYTESVSENLTTEKSKYWEKQAC